MTDSLVRAFLPKVDLQVSVAVATEAAREGARLHGMKPASAQLFAEALCGAALVASLQKDSSQTNLQLECDGPLRGLFVDARSTGALRGYVKNEWLEVTGNRGPFRWRPALGNRGFLSVLRDQGNGEYYRSSVELSAFDLPVDLNHYFLTSDQVPTRVALEVLERGTEAVAAVAGALVQTLPKGSEAALHALGATLQERLTALLAQQPELTAPALLAQLLEGQEYQLVAEQPLRWQCTCSKERVLAMLASLGPDELKDMIATQNGAVVTCQFCGQKQVCSADELRAQLPMAQA